MTLPGWLGVRDPRRRLGAVPLSVRVHHTSTPYHQPRLRPESPVETHDLLCAEQLLWGKALTLVTTRVNGLPRESGPAVSVRPRRVRVSPSLFDPSDPIPSRFNLMVDLERQRDELVRPREP